jgi:hypothetical protein
MKQTKKPLTPEESKIFVDWVVKKIVDDIFDKVKIVEEEKTDEP